MNREAAGVPLRWCGCAASGGGVHGFFLRLFFSWPAMEARERRRWSDDVLLAPLSSAAWVVLAAILCLSFSWPEGGGEKGNDGRLLGLADDFGWEHSEFQLPRRTPSDGTAWLPLFKVRRLTTPCSALVARGISSSSRGSFAASVSPPKLLLDQVASSLVRVGAVSPQGCSSPVCSKDLIAFLWAILKMCCVKVQGHIVIFHFLSRPFYNCTPTAG
jgi:hypothetical protein